MSDLSPVLLITGAVVVLVLVAWWLGKRAPDSSSMFGIKKGPGFK
jgi:hypothetical protein